MTDDLAPALDGPLEVVEYDRTWTGKFAAYRADLAAALGPVALRIEHVGSTAVPGLVAKNVVDIMVVVPDEADSRSYRAAIESTGLALAHRDAEQAWSFFRPPAPPRNRHIHVTSRGSQMEREQLLFVDYLRDHPVVAASYGALKQRLAARHADDRVGYRDEKTVFVTDVLRRADEWAEEVGWDPDHR
jgi:GrpB-like predicted nucleotidyltransferase (UPF0157 family)